MGAFGVGDVLEPAAHRGKDRRGDDPVEQGADARAVAGLAAGDRDRSRQLLAAPLEQAPELRDPAGLGRIGGDHAAELVDLEGGVSAVGVISAAGAALAVEHVAAERRLGAGDGGVDLADQEDDVVGASLPAQSLVAGAVGNGDHDDERDQGKRRQQRAGAHPQGTPGRRTTLLGRRNARLLRHCRKNTALARALEWRGRAVRPSLPLGSPRLTLVVRGSRACRPRPARARNPLQYRWCGLCCAGSATRHGAITKRRQR
jgi:hypothetical protein